MRTPEHKGSPVKTRPTMMDVAAMAGVSQATVSLVLNGSPGAKLTDETRRRVVNAAQEIGYQLTRRSAKRAPGNQSNIVFIADELTTDPWMALAYEGARDKALELGMNVCLAVSHGDPSNEDNIVTQMSQVSTLGFLYGTILTRQVELSKALANQPTVLVNCYDAEGAYLSVVPADLLGGRTATQHLLKSGAERIGFINGQSGLDASRDRLKGYKQALSSNDIAFDAELVQPGNWEPSSGYELTKKLMALPSPPDAIFCANDMMALGCYNALRDIGLNIPHDVAVIGFDDREIAKHAQPPMTTLSLPQYEMGEIAVEALIDHASGLKSGSNRIKVECPLVERQSVQITQQATAAQ